MTIKWGELYDMVSTGILFSAYACFVIIFTLAYFHPSGQVIVDITYFHEKHFEALLLVGTAPGVYRCFITLRDKIREWK